MPVGHNLRGIRSSEPVWRLKAAQVAVDVVSVSLPQGDHDGCSMGDNTAGVSHLCSLQSVDHSLMGKATVPAYDDIANSVKAQHPRNLTLSAVQFAKSTRETGGATMNVHTGDLAAVGEHAYVVGGSGVKEQHGRVLRKEPHTKNKGRDVPLNETLKQRSRVEATRPNSPEAAVGSWVHPNDTAVTYDSSDVFHNRAQAVTEGQNRREDAIFDLHKGKDIPLNNS